MRRRKGGAVSTRSKRPRLTTAEVAEAMNAINHPRFSRRRHRNTAQQQRLQQLADQQPNLFPVAPPAPVPMGDDDIPEIAVLAPPPQPANVFDDETSDEEEMPEDLSANFPRFVGFNRNFYIYPKDVLEFINRHSNELLVKRDGKTFINLDAMNNRFTRMIREQRRKSTNLIRVHRNTDEFIENEFYKMLRPEEFNASTNPDWVNPYMKTTAFNFFSTQRNLNDTLVIPGRDVYDLPNYIMLFILYRLAKESERHQSAYTLAYSLSADENGSTITPYNNDGNPITMMNREISVGDLYTMYITIMRTLAGIYTREMGSDDDENGLIWMGTEDSGTRIMLLNRSSKFDLFFKVLFFPVQHVREAFKWTPEIDKLIRESVGDSVISVKNPDDNKCLIYCLIMAIIMKKIDGGNRCFGQNDMMVDPSNIYCTAQYRFVDESNDFIKLIHKLARLLYPPLYSHGPIDPLFKFVENIDKDMGTMLNITEFREKFEETETQLIPDGICGIDVYGIDFNVNRHVYPLYISKNRENVVELLCVTPLDTNCSHYCVILNMKDLMKSSGGKQFWSCSKCGACFYHRRLLNNHKCPAQPHDAEVDGDGGYHYASKNVNKECDTICGICSKCRLCFTDDFTAAYHKKHCLMEGQTGYRHVQLKTYKQNEHPTLDGEAIDMEVENGHVRRRRVLYADFESSINPETGEHTFMSYGVYDWQGDKYQYGYDLQEFLDFILHITFSSKEQDQIYVYFHNAMGYDANFILRYVMKNEKYQNWGIQVIMKSSNKLQKLVFHVKDEVNDKTKTIHIGDTFLFLTLSLERIVDSIRKDDIEINKENFKRFFKVFQRTYPNVSIEDIDHILRKNIFPYKFFTDSTKLDVGFDDFIKIFEPKDENLQYFSERVTKTDLEQNFNDVLSVMQKFEIKTSRDYHDLYLCCDVMQLSDVFNRSMEILWESHHIHLTKYLGMPSASWAAFLRHDPNMKIALYEDTFYAEFFKGMIRGGITSAALRHAVADDKHSIIYLDVNGLYPYVMQAYKFPCGDFMFIPMGWTGELCNIKLEEYFKLCEEEGEGMCFCVDMEIPEDVKQMTDMYPFAPEHRKIFKEYYKDFSNKELTPFLKKWSEANNGEMMTEFTGLVCTLYDKKEYNVHWRLLKFYIEHGVKITKIYFGIKFKEGDYLAGYIRKNIEIRNTRKDELGKTLYKLLGNSIYGKTFESPFKRNTYEIVRDKTRLQGLLMEGNIASVIPIDDLGWIVRMDGEDIILDKPTYIGACVCEFAKLHMYTLLYDKLFKIFPGTSTDPGCQLIYTDTDSFIVRVRHPDGIGSDPKDLFAYIKSQDPNLIGGIGGQVKSETGEDDTIQEIIALRSKVYAYITKNGHIGKRAKGTTHDAQEMQLDWQTYKRALESLTSVNTENMQFIRKTFKIASLPVYRQSLSVNDGKRYICKDGIHTHAFGYNIPPEEQQEETNSDNEE